jgi:tetratricopeptide (TPR) repeat protein
LQRPPKPATEWVGELVKLGDLLRFKGEYDQAERVLSQAVAGAVHTQRSTDAMPPRAAALNALGIVYKDTGRYDAAAAAYSAALDQVIAATGLEHPCAAALWHNLAGLSYARGHPDQAETWATRAVRLHERQLGPDHQLVAQDLAVLGATILDQGRVEEAEAIFERALTIFRRRHPADRYEVAVNLSNLAACSVARGDLTNAERLLRHGLTIRQAILGFDHPETARQLNNIAVVVAQLHRTDEAVDLHRQAHGILEHTLPVSHPLTAVCRANAADETSGRCVAQAH